MVIDACEKSALCFPLADALQDFSKVSCYSQLLTVVLGCWCSSAMLLLSGQLSCPLYQLIGTCCLLVTPANAISL